MEVNDNEIRFFLKDGTKIIKIIQESLKPYRILCILENNENVYLKRNEKIIVKCFDCNNKFESRFNPRMYKENLWLCNSCRLSGNRNPFFGKKHSEETKKVVGEKASKRYSGSGNPMYGRSLKDCLTPEKYEEWKRNISKSISGSGNPMYGRSLKDCLTPEKYEEWKRNISNGLKTMYSSDIGEIVKEKLKESSKRLKESNPEYYRYIKQKAARISSKNSLKYKKSKTEIRVEEWLQKNNIEYNYSVIMSNGIRNYQFDFLIRNKRILIEVQGDYWHGNPEYYNLDGADGKHKLNEIQIAKINVDKEKEEYAKLKNFKLIHIWESDIKKNDFTVLKELLQ